MTTAHQTHAEESDDDSATSDDLERALPLETRPTLRPTAIKLGLVAVVGLVLVLVVVSAPSKFGGPSFANLLANAVLLVTAIAVVRYVVHVWVLKRTRYHVTADTIVREYDLLFRSWRREVPVEMIRSHELTQGRVQRLLGYGTIHVNQGLGEIRLEHVEQPHERHDVVTRIRRAAASRET
ncbi:MAG: PH domain-containing protein [Halobacteriaceae archaeon]